MRICLLIVVLLLPFRAKSEKDSIDLAFINFEKTLEQNFESFYNRKTRKIIHKRIVSFKNEAGVYLPMLVLSNTTYLASPPVLIMTDIDSVELKKIKNKEEREIYFIRRSLDDPEISLHFFRALLVTYFRDYGNHKNFDNDWLDQNNSSFAAFKLCCYHLLSSYFPSNASFRFIIGRWHYNRAVELINGIDDNESMNNILEIQEESVEELRIALPWFKEAARLYDPFTPVYNKILEELGLK